MLDKLQILVDVHLALSGFENAARWMSHLQLGWYGVRYDAFVGRDDDNVGSRGGFWSLICACGLRVGAGVLPVVSCGSHLGRAGGLWRLGAALA